MKIIDRTIKSIDEFQRSRFFIGFLYAVVKKYGQDNCGYLPAIVTYYGLLSLFPLLIVLTSLTQLLLKNNSAVRIRLSSTLNRYFPIIGNQLHQSVHSPRKVGLTLIISLLITFYGARGGASAFQYALSTIWNIPKVQQPPFLKNILRSFGIIIVGGIGLVAAVFLSGYTAILGKSIAVTLLAALLSVVVLWITMILVFKLAIAGNRAVSEIIVGAAIAAVGLQILQTFGGIILAHQLKKLSGEYGVFALVIGLLFWIYLQLQVIFYAVEVDVVRRFHLYPRSLQGDLIETDKHAFSKLAKATKFHKDEKVKVKFSSRDLE